MTSIERTAYPRLTTRKLKPSLLEELYTPTPADLTFVFNCLPKTKDNPQEKESYTQNHLNMLVLLKTFQHLGYFPKTETIPAQILEHMKTHLKLTSDTPITYSSLKTLYRHKQLIKKYLNFQDYNKEGKAIAHKIALDASKIHNYPADILNIVLEKLRQHNYELPTFDHLNRLVKEARYQINTELFENVSKILGEPYHARFDELIKSANRTDYNRIKQPPKNTTLTHFKELLAHHDWLLTLGSMEQALQNVTPIKQSHFAGQAKSLDASDLRKFLPAKRYCLMACLIHQMQQQAKDSLTIMFTKTMSKINKKAKDRLEDKRKQNKDKTHSLISLLKEVATDFQSKGLKKKCALIENQLNTHGGPVAVVQECEDLLACYTDNSLPFMWRCYVVSRSALFWLLKSLDLQSSHQDVSLLKAKEFILANALKKKPFLSLDNLDISFASSEWQKLILKKEGGKQHIVRGQFEVCVLHYLAKELHATNLWVPGSASFTDLRHQLLPWSECEPLISDYCKKVDIPTSGRQAVLFLKEKLTKKAQQVDDLYPKIDDLVIDEQGVPTLKRQRNPQDNPRIKALSLKIRALMPERNLIDILANTHHYTGWAHEFGPVSGSEPKLDQATERYIMTTFAYGTSMGPTQAAQHIKGDVSARMLSWVNRRHVSLKMQDKALVRLINYYNLFDLTQNWGLGKAAIADGTLKPTYEENLLTEYHVRYQAKGGIAYHHVADSYIALFSTFISCGVWEAVEIIEGLLKNESDIQPTTLHADTQGQSTIVFGLAFLLGITLMPRIRNWKDLIFFSSEPHCSYQNIGSLFKDHINWQLIENHWEDMLQVVLSIKAGKISSSALLRKLTSYSRKNKFYQAFQELGRVVRTLFLLDYISDKVMREDINAQTNKVESYNGFAAWIGFGNPYTVVASNDPEDQEKAIKHTDIIADSVMVQNTIDISNAVITLTNQGVPVTWNELKHIGPLMTEHLKRFGDFVVDLNNQPQDASKSLKLPIKTDLDRF